MCALGVAEWATAAMRRTGLDTQYALMGRFSCLWFGCEDRGIDAVQEFRRHQLRTIFPTTYRYNNAISVALDALAACLSSPPSRLRSEPQQD